MTLSTDYQRHYNYDKENPCMTNTNQSAPNLTFLTDRSKAVLFFVDNLCYLCFVFVMLPGLFIAALWSSAGKALTFWLSSI